MEKDEFRISKEDIELTEMLESKKQENIENNESIDIPLPKDKNKVRKGIALATAAVIGTAGIGYASQQARKEAETAIRKTEQIISEEPTYTEPQIDLEKPYINSEKIIKTSFEVEASAYVQVFQETALPKVKNDIKTYNFDTAEFSKSLYIPMTDIVTYIPLDVNVDDPSKECTNLRISPNHEKDNVIKKIQKGESIHIKPGSVKRDENECWFEALYPDGENLTFGYYCVVDEEEKNKDVEFTKEDSVFYYSCVTEDSRLYSKDEILDMYYQVTESEGLPFTKELGELDDFSYIPYGSIVKGTTNTDIKKTGNEDNYSWIQCFAEIDGKYQKGYIPYSKKFSNPSLKRIPKEKIYSNTVSKAK